MTRLSRSDLTLGPALGSGAQGKVYELVRARGFSAPFQLVYKDFSRNAEVNGPALDAAVAFRFGLDPGEREFLDRHTTWPLMVVEDGGEVDGYLMQTVPGAFFQEFRLSTGTKRKPRELQQLFQDDALSKRNLGIVPTWHERFRIARVSARILGFLHAHDLVFGDVSYKNEVWCLQPSTGVVFVDCDTIRPRGQSSALPQAHSPGWEPPEHGRIQTIETDRYKLGLLILRCLSPEVNAQNRDPAAADGRLDRQGRELLRRALGDDPPARPTGDDWVAYLDVALARLPTERVRRSGRPPKPAAPPPMVGVKRRSVSPLPSPSFRARIGVGRSAPVSPHKVYTSPPVSWKSPTPSHHGFGHPPSSPPSPAPVVPWSSGRRPTVGVIATMVGLGFVITIVLLIMVRVLTSIG